jgi:hypothetical protein
LFGNRMKLVCFLPKIPLIIISHHDHHLRLFLHVNCRRDDLSAEPMFHLGKRREQGTCWIMHSGLFTHTGRPAVE